MTTLDFIMAFESGEASPTEIVEGFSELVKSGMAWSLQGFYGRTATALIEDGYLDSDGTILKIDRRVGQLLIGCRDRDYAPALSDRRAQSQACCEHRSPARWRFESVP